MVLTPAAAESCVAALSYAQINGQEPPELSQLISRYFKCQAVAGVQCFHHIPTAVGSATSSRRRLRWSDWEQRVAVSCQVPGRLRPRPCCGRPPSKRTRPAFHGGESDAGRKVVKPTVAVKVFQRQKGATLNLKVVWLGWKHFRF